MGMRKIKPLAPVTAEWLHESSEYPDRIRLTMWDGTVQFYILDTHQPAPHVIPAKEILNCMPVYGGYKRSNDYKGKHAKAT